MHDSWSERADAAEEAVVGRHLRRLWGLPGTALGVVAWPPVKRERAFFRWNYWWQAHLLDCAVDATNRDPTHKRRRRLVKIARAHRIRNLTGWTNNYYDDMAWLGLSLERAQRLHLVENRRGIHAIEMRLFEGWSTEDGGGIPWRKGSDFFNAPANGPAAIMLARTGRLWRAEAMSDWIDATLMDADTGLVLDGIHAARATPSAPVTSTLDRAVYSYCQGVVLGLETELAVRVQTPRHAERVYALLDAVEQHLAPDGVIGGSGGGDGGLFNGILARYLAVVAAELPGTTDADVRARETAAGLVLSSAEAAWDNRLQVEGAPLFGSDWTAEAHLPGPGRKVATFAAGTVRSSEIAERDFSVQLSGWMLMEAAAAVAGLGYT